ncbi:MAG: glycosyltransferase, partial [Bacteroidales bacterium]
SVIIASYSKTPKLKKLTSECVKSLLKATRDYTGDIEIIICEQEPGVLHEGCRTLHYDFPFHYNKVLNYGAKHSSGKLLLFCNNDLEFTDGFLEGLVDCYDYGYRSICPYEPTRSKPFKQGRVVYEGYRTLFEMLGWCIMVERKLWKELGGFDEEFTFWSSENVYSCQLQDAGVKHGLCAFSVVRHAISQTLKTLPAVEQNELTMVQQRAFYKKYGYHRIS